MKETLRQNRERFRDRDGANINMVCVFCEQIVETESGAVPEFWGPTKNTTNQCRCQDVSYCGIEPDGRGQCVCHSCRVTHLIYDERRGNYSLNQNSTVPERALPNVVVENKYSPDRVSLCNEIASGLRARGLWCPPQDERQYGSDIILAIFKAIDREDNAAKQQQGFVTADG